MYTGPQIVRSGLVLYLDAANRRSYPTTGTTWTDLSGNSNTGTLTNGPTFSSTNSGTIIFDGVNDYVQGPTSTTLFSNRSFSVESWIFPAASPPAEQIYFSAWSSGATQSAFVMRIYNTGVLRVGYFNNDLDVSGISFNVWNHVTMTYNISGDLTSAYINGIFINSSNVGPFTPASANIRIGIWQFPGVEQPFKGNISTVSVYNRALSAAEVLQNYNATKSRYNL
jgi:hypothetical protein